MWFSYRPVQNGMAMVWHMHTFAGESTIYGESRVKTKRKSQTVKIALLFLAC